MDSLSFRGVVKRFGSLLANDHVSFDVKQGSVHALLGENGAGKTTLLSILAGFHRPDAGEILVDEEPLPAGSPRESLRRGIGFCAQHFLLADALTGAENVLLGRPDCTGLRAIPKERIERLHALAEANGISVPLDVRVEDLSIAEQERLEILKLLERNSRILVLDEPTSVLAPPEVGPLFATLRRLAQEGRTVLLVTHRLAEVEQVADRVTVLRHGAVVGQGDPKSIDRSQLIRWIAGEELAKPGKRVSVSRGAPILAARNLSCGSGPNGPRGIDLDVSEGEIVGLGGVLGNGQTEIVQVLTGQIGLLDGSVRLFEQDVKAPGYLKLPREVAWIPDDRRSEGLALEMSCEENLRIGIPYASAPRGEEAARLMVSFTVQPADPALTVSHLSGGNQQRLLLAREMSRGARFLLAVHPTRGLDPTATAFVHERLLEARERGVGILLITGDLDELRTLSDSVRILFRGKIGYAATADTLDVDAMNRALVGVES